MTEPAVRLTDVSKKFRLRSHRRDSIKERLVRGRAEATEDFWALRDATFEIPRGSCFGLVGHNGSGKSTALKVMAGIYRPTTGTVEVAGRVSALLELGAGFHPELTGRENIVLNGALLGMTRSEIDAATGAIIDFSGLGEFIDAPVKVYSSGMHVRLGFAIAVAVDPDILIVDEVIAVGDEEFQRKCMEHFHDLRRKGSTIILVSHGMSVMSDLCDEAVWLDHGHVRQKGSARHVVAAYMDEINGSESRIDDSGLVHAGTGGANIDSVQFLDPASGEELSNVVTNQPCTIRVNLTAQRPLERAVLGLMFLSENGVDVAGPNTSNDGLLAVAEGPHSFDYVLDGLPLAPGVYGVSAAVIEDAVFLDYVHRASVLRVRDDGHFDRGLVRLPGTWLPPTS